MHFSPLCLGWGVSDWEGEGEREEGVFIKESGVELQSITHTRAYTAAALKTNQNKKETFVPCFLFTLKVHKGRKNNNASFILF